VDVYSTVMAAQNRRPAFAKNTVGIFGNLAREGAKDITLLVHGYYVGRPSPSVVIEDGVNVGLTGGHIESLDQVFQTAANKHPGYIVQERLMIEMEASGSADAQCVRANWDA